MLKVVEKPVSPRRLVSAGKRVSKKYRIAQQNKLIKKREYKKLKAIVPAISSKNKVPKITVIEEAIKYIDELHVALAKRMHLLKGIAPGIFPNQINRSMLAPIFPFPPSVNNNNNNLPMMMSMQPSPLKPVLCAMPLLGLHRMDRKR